MFSCEDAAKIASDLFGVVATQLPSVLPSYDDQNFRIGTDQGNEFVLKIAHSGDGVEFLQLQNELMIFLNKSLQTTSFQIPQVVTTQTAEGIVVFTNPNTQTTHNIRLLTFLPGVPLSTVEDVNDSLLTQLGQSLANLDKALTNFTPSNEAIVNASRRYESWDICNALEMRSVLFAVPEARHQILNTFLGLFETRAKPQLPQLPRCVIHNDANDDNILVSTDRSKIVGIVDFGDAVETCIVNEIAIACAYVMVRHCSPIAAATTLTRAYHQVFPLSEGEIECLPILVFARLCVSVLHSAKKRHDFPLADPYTFVTEKPAWALLESVYAQGAEAVCANFSANVTASQSKEHTNKN